MKRILTLCAATLLTASCWGSTPLQARRAGSSSSGLNPWFKTPEGFFPRRSVWHSLPQGASRAVSPGSTAGIFSKGMAKTPAAKVADGLYGWLTYYESDDDQSLYGLNLLGLDGSVTNIFSFQEGYFTGLWLRDGKWCSYVPTIIQSTLQSNNYMEFDAATGELVTDLELPMRVDNAFLLSCYDATSDCVYGYTYNSSGDGIQFSKVSGEHPDMIEKVADADIEDNVRACTFNSKKGVFVGINADVELVEVDPATGKSTVIGSVDVPSFYLAGMTYDAANDRYIYNAQPQDTKSYLYSIDANTLETKLLCTYEDGKSFIGLWMEGAGTPAINTAAPQQATGFVADFPKGALKGAVSFRLPTANVGGQPILGNVAWVLEIDGKEVRRGTGAAASEVVVKGIELTEGIHRFSVTCSLGSNIGDSAVSSVFLGNDTPLAPADVELTPEKVSWTPVTAGVNGGWIDPAGVTYTVWINDKKVATGVNSSSCPTGLPADTELKLYTAKVMASFDGKDSEIATSNDITFGDALHLPVSLVPTEEEFDLFTVFDANNDGKSVYRKTQLIKGEKVPFVVCNYHRTNSSDDWVWLPAVLFNDASKVYRFEMMAALFNKYPERFEVKIGAAPTVDAMTQTVIGVTDVDIPIVTVGGEVTYGSEFMVPDAGKYYIGIHYMSDPDMYQLGLNNFKITTTDFTAQSPRAPGELTATAGAEGALNAEVTFTMPSANILGTAYAADKQLKGFVTTPASADPVEVTGLPGQTVKVNVPTLQGENTLKVYVADGNDRSSEIETGVFTGLDIPSAVTDFNMTTSDDNMTLKMSWKAPVEGENGGYVSPEEVTYYLAQVVDGYWQIQGEIGTDVFSYDFTLPEGTPLDLYSVGVIAANASGRSGSLAGYSIMVGKPYTLPMAENFADASVDYTPLATYSGLSWAIGDPAKIDEYLANDGRIAFIGYPSAPGYNQSARLSLPRFSTKGITKPAFEFETLGQCCNSVEIYAETVGVPMTLVGTMDLSELDKQTLTLGVDLPETFADRGWVEISLKPSVNAASSWSDAFVLYSYKMKNAVPHDMAVSAITGGPTAQYGSTCVIKGIITNEGTEETTFQGATWTLTGADDTVIASVEVPAASAASVPGEKIETPISFTPTADMGATLNLRLALKGTDDFSLNDEKSVKITVKKGDTPVITDLEAREVTYSSVTLGWSELAGSATVESFENEAPFVHSPETIAGFRNVDADGSPTFTFQGGEQVPGARQPGAFTVWSSEKLVEYTGGSTLPAADGDHFIIAFSAAPASSTQEAPATDDWLISPEIAGGSTFSFSACPFSYSYPETLRVCVSTTDDDPESFTLVEEIELAPKPNATQLEWEDFSIQLPADARYVAINYASVDQLAVMIDRISYVPASSRIALAGYDIYRDGMSIADKAKCDGCTFTDDNVEENKDYSYIVVPVLANGTKGLNSNTLRIRTSGIGGVAAGARAVFASQGVITVNGYEGKRVVVVASDGKTIGSTASATASERFAVTSGVYVVKADGDTFKLIVK